jgi:hypothetical protein
VTWGALWLLTLVFYLVFLSLSGDVILVSLSWTVLDVLNLCGIIILDVKSHKIFSMLLNPSDFPRHRLSLQSTGRVVRSSIRFLPHALKETHPSTPSSQDERSSLLPSREDLPAWTAVNPNPPCPIDTSPYFG